MVIVIFFLGGVNAEDRDIPPDEQTLLSSSPLYEDTCDYRLSNGNRNYMCGDQCYNFRGQCNCGPDIDIKLGYTSNPERCCIPSNESCTSANGFNVTCDEGIVLPLNSFCYNTKRSLQCYNSYQDSQYIGMRSHYTYPNRNMSGCQLSRQ